MHGFSRLALTIGAALVVAGNLAAQSPVRYIYDELGRLVGVIDSSGAAAAYHYDAVGNLISITRSSANQVSIVEFSPNSGTVGVAVALYGTGFSAVAAENLVSFNGASATIVSASPTQLTVTVPTGATTGAISVTTPNGSAVGSPAFQVTSSNGLPTITSFSPAIAAPGDSLTVDGQNFDAAVPSNNLKVNVRRATVGSLTGTTRLNATVPAQGTSGRITVTTPLGTAISSADLFVAPPPYPGSDVAYTGRFATGESRTISVGAAHRIGLLIFDGTMSQRVSIKFTAGPSSEIKLLNPDGSVLRSAGLSSFGAFIDAVTLPTAGTYTIMLDPFSTGTGSTTATLYAVLPDVSGTIVPGGTAFSVPITTPGQNARLTFQATTGQRISARAEVTSGAFGGCGWTISIVTSDGATLGSSDSCGTTAFLEPVTIPATGTYTYVIDPYTTNTGTATVNLYDVPADVTGGINSDGSSAAVTLGVPGQNARLTFSGTTGQRVSAKTTVSSGNFGCAWTLGILNPDTTTLDSAGTCSSTAFLEPVTLPSAGPFTYLIDPRVNGTGAATANLYTVVDVTGTLVVGDPAVPINLPTPGQKALLTFSGTATQQVTVRLTNNTTGVNGVSVKLLGPTGAVITQMSSSASSFNLTTQTLSTTGIYTVVIDPITSNTGSISVRVTNP